MCYDKRNAGFCELMTNGRFTSRDRQLGRRSGRELRNSFWATSFEVWLIKYRRWLDIYREREKGRIFTFKKTLFSLNSSTLFHIHKASHNAIYGLSELFCFEQCQIFMDRSLSFKGIYFLVLFSSRDITHTCKIFRTFTYFVFE